MKNCGLLAKFTKFWFAFVKGTVIAKTDVGEQILKCDEIISQMLRFVAIRTDGDGFTAKLAIAS